MFRVVCGGAAMPKHPSVTMSLRPDHEFRKFIPGFEDPDLE